MPGELGRQSPATLPLSTPAAAQTAGMDMSLHVKRLLMRWRVARVDRVAEKPAPDPADCGTAWGLELTVAPRETRDRAAHGERRRRG